MRDHVPERPAMPTTAGTTIKPSAGAFVFAVACGLGRPGIVSCCHTRTHQGYSFRSRTHKRRRSATLFNFRW